MVVFLVVSGVILVIMGFFKKSELLLTTHGQVLNLTRSGFRSPFSDLARTIRNQQRIWKANIGKNLDKKAIPLRQQEENVVNNLEESSQYIKKMAQSKIRAISFFNFFVYYFTIGIFISLIFFILSEVPIVTEAITILDQISVLLQLCLIWPLILAVSISVQRVDMSNLMVIVSVVGTVLYTQYLKRIRTKKRSQANPLTIETIFDEGIENDSENLARNQKDE